MARSFKDRFLTPKVARAIMSPLGIVLFGAGTAAAVLGGLGLFAPLVGVGAWSANVLRSVPRDPQPFTATVTKLAEPWSTYVADARQARQRFDDVVTSMAAGPLQGRLAELGRRLDDAVGETDRIATRGNALSEALGRIDIVTPQAELARIRSEHTGRGMSPTTTETVRALDAQVQAGQRVAAAAHQAQERLQMLDARYDELVARAVEVSLGTGDSESLGHEVDELVTDLEALRQALDETATTP